VKIEDRASVFWDRWNHPSSATIAASYPPSLSTAGP
jgi:hypothetical protein